MFSRYFYKISLLFAVAPPLGKKKSAYTADRRHDGHQSAQGHRETAHVVEKSLAAWSTWSGSVTRRVSIKIMVPQKVPHHQPTVMFLKVKHDSFYHFLSRGFNDMLNRFVSKVAVPSWERSKYPSLWNSENHHLPNRYPSIGTLIFTKTFYHTKSTKSTKFM